MDDFDIDLDSDIGTSVSKLKGKDQQKIHTDTDIDYDKILDSINNSETIKQVNSNYTSYDNSLNMRDFRPKKEINMGQFIKNVETDLDKLNDVDLNEPLPINFNKNIIKQSPDVSEKINSIKINQTTADTSFLSDYFNYDKINFGEYKNLIICILLFILLNNKFIIEFIYDKFPYLNRNQNPHFNLVIRSMIYGIILYLIKI